ncbi:MAG: PEGA domain-containing protein [Candidatus Eisenbacteria bacterium]|nr:PEGA domain-containing protein [Candidatus Eisenbacteria bacterium]
MRLAGTGIARRLRGATLIGLLFATLAVPEPARGQEPGVQQVPPALLAPLGVLRIRSEPSGALVTLAGAHRWRGTTPWDLQRGLQGTYWVSATLSGFERWRRTIEIAPGDVRDLSIELVPKQRWKAAARSVLLPGWGQRYAEQPGKGALFMLGSLGAVGGLWWLDEDYKDHVESFRAARDAYLAEENVTWLDDKRRQMERAQRRADRAYDRRQVLLVATVGVYALSVLDAFLFFPEPAGGIYAGVAPWGAGGPMLAVGGEEPSGIGLSLRWPLHGGVKR